MHDNDAIAALLEYDHWCTDQLAAKMETLSADDLQQKFPIGWHTLHRTLYHLVAVAEHWTDRSRPQPTGLRGGAADADPNTLTVASLRQRYKSAGQQMFANLVALRATPDSAKDAGWLLRRNHLIHITTHGMHHRAQIIFMLTQLGVAVVIEGGDFGGWANEPLKTSIERKTIAQYL